jgi:hypothetical protein
MPPKKPSFPSRPCPKCGKPIHIKSKKHDECGWRLEGSAAAPVAARGSEANKSVAVKEVLGKNPKTPVKEVVSALAAQGIKVSANYVYTLKSKMKARKRAEKREKALAVGAGAQVANPLELIREVKQLAARAGGLGNLKQLVDVLAE